MNKQILKQAKKDRRHNRSRVRMHGTAEKPRASIFRSNNHIFVQLVDDSVGKTLASVSTVSVKEGKTKSEKSTVLGKLLAEKAKSVGVSHIVFDRGGNKYHGRIKALAESAREAGLNF